MLAHRWPPRHSRRIKHLTGERGCYLAPHQPKDPTTERFHRLQGTRGFRANVKLFTRHSLEIRWNERCAIGHEQFTKRRLGNHWYRQRCVVLFRSQQKQQAVSRGRSSQRPKQSAEAEAASRSRSSRQKPKQPAEAEAASRRRTRQPAAVPRTSPRLHSKLPPSAPQAYAAAHRPPVSGAVPTSRLGRSYSRTNAWTA